MNMSYCAAENTALAIDQLIGLINDGEKTHDECSHREWSAMKRLRALAEELESTLESWEWENEDDLQSSNYETFS